LDILYRLSLSGHTLQTYPSWHRAHPLSGLELRLVGQMPWWMEIIWIDTNTAEMASGATMTLTF
jgi:hypothetical protein